MIQCSIAMAAYNKADILRKVLVSIRKQNPPFAYEIVVADDSSTDETPKVCEEFEVRYTKVTRPDVPYRNPAVVRNAAFRLCRGEIVINQSGDVEHVNNDTIQQLCERLKPDTCTIARVINLNHYRAVISDHFGYRPHRLVFFLGAIWRKELFAMGGQDEEFTEPGYEDTWFRMCLQRRGFHAEFLDDVIGFHHDHPKPEYSRKSFLLFSRKMHRARNNRHPWGSRSGPWEYTE